MRAAGAMRAAPNRPNRTFVLPFIPPVSEVRVAASDQPFCLYEAARPQDNQVVSFGQPNIENTKVRAQSPVESSVSLDRTEYGNGVAHSGRA
jgi:hypothetical protein